MADGDNQNLVLDEEEFEYIPVPDQVDFGSSMMILSGDGSKVFTDYAQPKNGDVYHGMAASMAAVPQYASSETTTLDDPGSMTKLHTKQRFPVGTQTVSRIGYNNNHFYYYYLWTYTKLSSGYLFLNTGFYCTDPKMSLMPPKSVTNLYTKGGYWYREVKYP